MKVAEFWTNTALQNLDHVRSRGHATAGEGVYYSFSPIAAWTLAQSRSMDVVISTVFVVSNQANSCLKILRMYCLLIDAPCRAADHRRHPLDIVPQAKRITER
jgi:hypothetical protein